MPDSPGPRAPRVAVVVLATTPAARLSCGDGTLLDRLNGQLATLPVRDVQVVARTAVALGSGAADSARDVAEDLRSVAKAARAGATAIAVLPGDLVAHTEALASIIDHPGRGTAALVARDGDAPLHPPVRVVKGRVVEAGSSFHRVANANAVFRGVLQVGEADLGGLARVADELAEHVEAGRLGAVTPSEVGDLILVGLVRSGIPVRACELGGLRCERVSDAAAAEEAVRGLAEVDEAEAKLAAADRPAPGVLTALLIDPWARLLVRPAARLGLTADAVTGISLAMAFLAAVWYSEGGRGAMLLAGALFVLAFALDRVDGRLARYTRSFSPIGGWLDTVCGRAGEFMVYVGLAAGYPTADGPSAGFWPGGIWTLMVAVMILQVLRDTLDDAYAGARADAARVGAAHYRVPRPLTVPLSEPPAEPGGEADGGGGEPSAERAGPLRAGRDGAADAGQRPRSDTAGRLALALPTGERVALIAVTAALFDARVTFLALLLWGGAATAATVVGRIARALT